MAVLSSVVFFCGAGHSGSTLLGMILGNVAGGFYAGEAAKSRFLGSSEKAENKRTCKVCGLNCPIWGNWIPRKDISLAQQLTERMGATHIVDSSKSLEWVNAQLPLLPVAIPRLILLLRDGRAVVASRKRKYPQTPFEAHILEWSAQINSALQFFHSFKGPKCVVHYEELARTPEVTVHTICAQLDIPFHETMLQFHDKDFHMLGGNSGTQSQLTSMKDRSSALGAEKREYYERHPRDIVLDTRFERELAENELALFDELAQGTLESLRSL